MLVSAESQVPNQSWNYFCGIPTRVIIIHQRYTDGQTDGQTTYHGNTALRYASRGKNE